MNIADATILQMFLADHTVPYPIGEIIGNTETPTQPATQAPTAAPTSTPKTKRKTANIDAAHGNSVTISSSI